MTRRAVASDSNALDLFQEVDVRVVAHPGLHHHLTQLGGAGEGLGVVQIVPVPHNDEFVGVVGVPEKRKFSIACF